MLIFLDSNIFFNNWYAKNPHFQYLFNFINNESHTLLLSKLVIEETNNNRRKEVDSILQKYNEVARAYRKVTAFQRSDIGINIDCGEYDLLDVLKDKTENVVVFEYSELKHDEVVERALGEKRPFLKSEKGYRDTLIWLSLLYYIKSTKQDKNVIFISNNKSDFFRKKSKEVFLHEDLLKDIQDYNIKNNIIPYDSLYSFVKGQIDEEHHAVDYNNLIDAVESDLKSEAIEYLESVKTFNVVYRSNGGYVQDKIEEVIEVEAEIIEGIEDPEVMSSSKVKGNLFHIGFSYNLRIVEFNIYVPKSYYLINKDNLKEMVFEIFELDDTVKLVACARPYFFCSFIYDSESMSFDDFYVDDMSIKI